MYDLQDYRNIPLPKLRNHVIDQLKLNYAHDNLEVEDFETRLESANALEDKFELLGLLRDLPAIREGEDGLEDESEMGVRINRGRVRSGETMFAILGGAERSGEWHPARDIKVLALMGGVDLDLSEAYLPPEGLSIEVVAIMGGMDVIVPEGINVEVSGVPLLGGFDNKTSGRHYPNAPTLRVSGVAMMGGIDIKTKKRRKK
jgi:hypothetical protein